MSIDELVRRGELPSPHWDGTTGGLWFAWELLEQRSLIPAAEWT
jgi:hypothetical protein